MQPPSKSRRTTSHRVLWKHGLGGTIISSGGFIAGQTYDVMGNEGSIRTNLKKYTGVTGHSVRKNGEKWKVTPVRDIAASQVTPPALPKALQKKGP
jgi:hypothetical protein